MALLIFVAAFSIYYWQYFQFPFSLLYCLVPLTALAALCYILLPYGDECCSWVIVLLSLASLLPFFLIENPKRSLFAPDPQYDYHYFHLILAVSLMSALARFAPRLLAQKSK